MTSSSTRKTQASRFYARDRGFSLVEVALAVGILGFVFAGLFGLMAIGLEEGKRARQETLVSAMAELVISHLKETGAPGTPYYFSADGFECESDKAFYFCEVTESAPTTPKREIEEQCKQFSVVFRWPCRPGAGASYPYEESFTTTLSRH